MMPTILIAAGALAAAILLMLAFMRRDATRPVLETVVLHDGGSDDGSGSGGSDEGGGLRVLQLSDIHIKISGAPLAKIIPMIKAANPHVIMMTGDYIDSPKDAGRFIAWMGELAGAVGGARIYLCYGNHDIKAFSLSPTLRRDMTKALKQLGAYVMENRTLSFEHAGKQYAVTGFSDYHAAPYYNVRKALNGTPKGAAYHIGISHNPDLALELSGPAPNLLLLGHFHGGQIWMPFHLEYTCLRKERLCKTGIRQGLHEYGGRHIYISRGLGCVLFPLRLGSRPEITLFVLP